MSAEKIHQLKKIKAEVEQILAELYVHAERHENNGGDEINVEGLSGELADEQKSAWDKVSGKPSTYPPMIHAAEHLIGGSDPLALTTAEIPNLPASKITSGIFDLARIPSIDWGRISANFPRTIAELLSDHTKAVHDALGLSHDSLSDVSPSDHHVKTTSLADITDHDLAHHPLSIIPTMDDGHIPNLETLSYGGAFALAQIPNLPASKTTSGTFDLARIPTPLTGKDADLWDGKHRTDAQTIGGDVTIGGNLLLPSIPSSDRFDDLTIIKAIKSVDGKIDPNSLPDWLHGSGINVNALLGLLIGSIKQLSRRVEELEAK